MIQDIAPHRFENSYCKKRNPRGNDRLLLFTDRMCVMLHSETGEFPQIAETGLDDSKLWYLFSIDDTAFFGSDADISEKLAAKGFEFRGLHDMRGDRNAEISDIFAAMSGFHLYRWYSDSRFCGRCGGKTMHSESERAVFCPECRNIIYPRIMPAVIVGVTKGDKLLLTKYRKGYRHFALVAGFAEFGETLEECVKREVMEETGLSVKNIRYYKSQPWGIAQDLLAGFFCDAEEGCEIKMDSDELKLAEWFSREEIVLQPDSMSLTGEMMKKFRNGEI